MALVFKKGRPPNLTEEKIEHIIKHIPGNYTIRQVARMSGVPFSCIQSWLDLGISDRENSIDSIYAQLSVKWQEAEGKEIKRLMAEMDEIKSFNSINWMVEKNFPEEYGSDTLLVRDIKREIIQAKQGALNNGKEESKELDQGSH